MNKQRINEITDILNNLKYTKDKSKSHRIGGYFNIKDTEQIIRIEDKQLTVKQLKEYYAAVYGRLIKSSIAFIKIELCKHDIFHFYIYDKNKKITEIPIPFIYFTDCNDCCIHASNLLKKYEGSRISMYTQQAYDISAYISKNEISNPEYIDAICTIDFDRTIGKIVKRIDFTFNNTDILGNGCFSIQDTQYCFKNIDYMRLISGSDEKMKILNDSNRAAHIEELKYKFSKHEKMKDMCIFYSSLTDEEKLKLLLD